MDNIKSDLLSTMSFPEMYNMVTEHLKEKLFNYYMKKICTVINEMEDNDTCVGVDINPVKDCETFEQTYSLEDKTILVKNFSLLYLDVLNDVLHRLVPDYVEYDISIRYKETRTETNGKVNDSRSYPIFTVYVKRSWSDEEEE